MGIRGREKACSEATDTKRENEKGGLFVLRAMREAANPWGPFSDKIPLVDCLAMDQRLRNHELLDVSENEIPYYFYPTDYMGLFSTGGGCYGGYTHSDLIFPHNDRLVIHFNTSLWQPYKAVLMETDIEWQE